MEEKNYKEFYDERPLYVAHDNFFDHVAIVRAEPPLNITPKIICLKKRHVRIVKMKRIGEMTISKHVLNGSHSQILIV